LLVAILPVKAIWALHIQKMQKIALLIILTLGWFVCIVSILRLHSLVVLAQHPEDSTWYSTSTAYWSAIEVNLAIICASTPALKPLVGKLIPAFSTRNTNWGYTSNTAGTKQNKSVKGRFVQLGDRIHPSTATEQTELGDSPQITALPVVSHGPNGKAIYVQHDFERHFKGSGRESGSDSERNLVSTSCNVTVRH
jgi:hypothetical protein